MMLYQEIRQGCEEYHTKTHADARIRAYDKAYEDYMCNKDKDAWRHLDALPLAEACKLLAFLKKWRAWRVGSPGVTDLHVALKDVAEEMIPLMDKSILDLKLSELYDEEKLRIGADTDNIHSVFKKLAKCGDNTASTAPSKILHAINPDGFVMWDLNIRRAYAQKLLRKKTPLTGPVDYVLRFLPEMREIAKRAVNEVRAEENLSRPEAIQSFTDHCEKKNTLAKIIDEYNYAKYTKGWL